jgi:dipeptidyl aminopeptidase/acylaminoacyl peptidase
MAARRAGGRATTSRPQRAYTIRDQVALRRLHDFVVSPDGSRLILEIESAVPGRNRLDTRLWSIGADGTGLRRLTRSRGRESNPAFAPDGRSVYFLAGSHTGDRRVMRLAFEGGKPIPLTRSPVDIESFVLSRDGAFLAFSAQVFPGGPDTLGSTAERLNADARKTTSGQVHDRLFVRHWDQWKTGRRRHLLRLLPRPRARCRMGQAAARYRAHQRAHHGAARVWAGHVSPFDLCQLANAPPRSSFLPAQPPRRMLKSTYLA